MQTARLPDASRLHHLFFICGKYFQLAEICKIWLFWYLLRYECELLGHWHPLGDAQQDKEPVRAVVLKALQEFGQQLQPVAFLLRWKRPDSYRYAQVAKSPNDHQGAGIRCKSKRVFITKLELGLPPLPTQRLRRGAPSFGLHCLYREYSGEKVTKRVFRLKDY